jgi:hypothetical protein
MSDRVVLTIELPSDELEDLARRRGYDTPADYVRALIVEDAEADAESHGTGEDLITRFRRSWQDALAGKTYPVSTLWDGIDDDDE